MPEPISESRLGMAASAQPDARMRADEMLAAMLYPSGADLAELQQGGSHLDRLLAAQQADVNGLVAEFKQARKPLQHSRG
ncbi:hypothetical protein [Acidovorax sp. Leaf78]|uniref:hypothetical protein n=1 Tax=Acidovorax sp. Leaf78 TaxID=1736237 RepID=UPI0012E215DA|nr:hypothetical protein [Acidovorax sp. Leaf78]